MSHHEHRKQVCFVRCEASPMLKLQTPLQVRFLRCEASRMPKLRTLLSDYFPTDLARVIKRAVTIKPKVLVSCLHIVTLDSGGVVNIINFEDKEKPKVTKTIRHIHDIFPGRSELPIDIAAFCLLTNTNKVISIEEIDWVNYNDIIHISIGSFVIIYTNVRGEMIVDSSRSDTKIDFPEPVVAASQTSLLANAVTAITNEEILFLTVSGLVRFYGSRIGSLYGDDASFEELTLEFWRKMKQEVNLKTCVIENLDEEDTFHDVIKIFPGTSYVLTLNNILVDTNESPRGDHDHVVDFASPIEGPELELLLNKSIKINDKPVPHIKDIIAISSDVNSALVQADGRVLIKLKLGHTFTTIPRLRLVIE